MMRHDPYEHLFATCTLCGCDIVDNDATSHAGALAHEDCALAADAGAYDDCDDDGDFAPAGALLGALTGDAAFGLRLARACGLAVAL